jgi:hypothetical protein
MRGWEKLDARTSKNLCNMVWYAFCQLDAINPIRRNSFISKVLGNASPCYHNSDASAPYDARVVSLTDRTYLFLTSKCTPGLMEVLYSVTADLLSSRNVSMESL